MKVTLAITTVKQDLAPGQVLSDWSFVVSSSGAQVGRQDVPAPTADFDLPSGAYSATAQRFDSMGTAFGAQVAVEFTVPEQAPVAVEQGDAAGALAFTLS